MNKELKNACDSLCSQFNNYFSTEDNVFLKLYTGPTSLKEHFVLNVFFKALDEEKKLKTLSLSILTKRDKQEFNLVLKYIKKNI